MPTRSDGGPGAPDSDRAPAPDSDGGPLKKLSLVVLVALAVEIALFAWLGQAAS